MALVVVLDGEPMDEPLAKAFWQRFSAYMEAHKGDLGGFAASEGLASVHPKLLDGRPALVASRQDGQRPYVSAVADEGGAPSGSRGGARTPASPASTGGNPARRRDGKGPKRR